MTSLILIIFAYVCGSIPNALWIGKVFKGIDVREHGSKNTGSTNAARVLGAKLGILTLILDVSKGVIPVLMANVIGASDIERIVNIKGIDPLLVGVFAILGHVFSIFMKFKGGKAVATTAGVFIVLAPKTIVIVLLIFIVVFAIFRYVSLASICAATSLPILLFIIEKQNILTILGLAIAILVIVKHKSNIIRLKEGTEPKFTLKKK